MYKLLLFCCLAAAQLHGQAIIFDQIFQPSVRLNAEYAPDAGSSLFGNKDKFGYTRANFNLIIPIKSKLGVKVDWISAIDKLKNWRQLRLKDIGDVARVKMYQVFWNLRPQVFYTQYEPLTDSLALSPRPTQAAFGLSTGITGLHLLKNFRILFYSGNFSFMEDKNSIKQFSPNFTGAIGVAHINRVIYYWYYGAAFSYNNGRFTPIPFFGIQANLMKKLWLNITLPMQLRLGWSINKVTKFDFVTALSGYSNGFAYQNNAQTDYIRSFYTGFQLRTAGVFTFKMGKQTKLYLEAGVLPYRRLSFGKSADGYHKPELNPTFYGGFSFFYSFKKSLLGSVIDGLISF